MFTVPNRKDALISLFAPDMCPITPGNIRFIGSSHKNIVALVTRLSHGISGSIHPDEMRKMNAGYDIVKSNRRTIAVSGFGPFSSMGRKRR